MTAQGDLNGQVAIVTGGSRGIGRAIVVELARAGCAVVFTYHQAAEAAKQLAESLQPARVLALQADVRDGRAAQSVIEMAREAFSRVDILINNAGITRDRALALMEEADWRDVIEINLTGCFYYARAVAPLLMRQMSGRIVNITSVSGVRGLAGQANYAAAKAGMIGLTKSLAKELGPYNITVNAIAPGYIETEMLDHLSESFKAKMRQLVALRRFGQPEEVAHLTRFLASDSASYITGQVIVMDGGLGM